MPHGRLGTMVAITVLAVAACSGGGATTPASGSGNAPTMAGASSSTGGSSPGGAVKPGEPLCGLLGPGDFAGVGLHGAGVPRLNGDGTTEAYCVYAGTSAAAGGLEFDAFVSADTAGTADLFTTVVGEAAGGTSAKAALPGVDDAVLNPSVEGTYATIAVRAGRLVFDVGVPRGDAAKDQLLALATLVLQRSAALL